MQLSYKDRIKKEIIPLLPHQPGVYRFYDNAGKIIYVGKAKDLKKRVSSYFAASNKLNTKTLRLVSQIAEIKYTVVENEQDAFLLENNLIKENQPKYNILLKDSKTYPWICLKNEPFPRLFTTRRIVKDGSLYFGPYSSAHYAHSLIELLHSLFKLRDCNLKLTCGEIEKGRFKECLNYHIKKCEAPCIGKISEQQYLTNIESIKSILKGNTAAMIRHFKEQMNSCAANLDFEAAQANKEKMELLNAHYNKSLIVQPSLTNLDIFYITTAPATESAEPTSAFGNYMRVCQGCITQVLNLELKIGADEAQEDILTRFMMGVYDILRTSETLPSREIIVPFLPSGNLLPQEYNIHIPLKGDKLALLELSKKNAREFMLQTLKQQALKNPQDKMAVGVQMLQKDLNLKRAPIHIECFDNSNTQGTNPVASCVVFRDGKPSKKDYRKFKIKTVVGANDFASMYEVVTRRYSRLLEEERENPEQELLPQLIVVDGGKGQLDFAYKALVDLGIAERVPIIGIAKRLEELLRPGDPNPLFLDKNSPSLKIIMQLRDEAHRFGITFHRSLRSKGQINSELSEIPGIGEITAQKLLQKFKSVKRIKEADLEQLQEVVGKSAAQKITAYFRKSQSSNS